jgi:hypothetical protein
LKTSKNSLRAMYFHTPQNTNTFTRLFSETFDGVLEYRIHQMYHRLVFNMPIRETFDPETGTWKFDPKDYKIHPLPLSKSV